MAFLISHLSTAPRCLMRFKTQYTVDSGYPISRVIAGPFNPALCNQQLHSSQTKTVEHVLGPSQKR